MSLFAVITGDFVKSLSLELNEKNKIKKGLKDFFDALDETKGGLDFYRGDSFQGLIEEPESALGRILQLKCIMKINSPLKGQEVRISLGLGNIEVWPENGLEGDGPAYIISGRNLSILEKSKSNLSIVGTNKEINKDLVVYCEVLDHITSHWTTEQAEAIFYLLEGMTQMEIAKKLKISQPSVFERKEAGNWNLVKSIVKRYEEIIKTQLQDN